METNVLYKLSNGVYIIGAFMDGRAVGCTIDTCFQITSENPLLNISLNKKNYTLEAIKANKRFSLSIVSLDTDPEIIGRFGFVSSRDTDKYNGRGYDVIAGAPCVKGTFAGRLILEAERFIDCETHMLVIARLVDTEAGEGEPMTYAYYRNSVKAKATTTVEKETATPQKKMRRYECELCGYIAEFEGEIPEDYICPLCGADSSQFHEIN